MNTKPWKTRGISPFTRLFLSVVFFSPLCFLFFYYYDFLRPVDPITATARKGKMEDDEGVKNKG